MFVKYSRPRTPAPRDRSWRRHGDTRTHLGYGSPVAGGTHAELKVLTVPLFLRSATAVVALVVALWAGYSAARDRAPSRWQLRSVLVVEAVAVVLAVWAIVSISGGRRAHDMATFIGYLVAFLIVPIAGWALARMEPSRWGSVIIAAVAVVEAILVVRLQQVWVGI